MLIKAKYRIQASDGEKMKTVITAGKIYRAELKKWLYFVSDDTGGISVYSPDYFRRMFAILDDEITDSITAQRRESGNER